MFVKPPQNVPRAHELEARRTRVYQLTDDERAAIRKAREGDFVPDEEVDAFWNRHA
jgi:hypothetical protein